MTNFNRKRALAIRSVALALSAALLPAAVPTAAQAQSAAGRPEWPGPGQLFVGTNYQPVDRSPAQIRQDIALMKSAGFNMVRTGDLSWDSFEPEEGRFTFEWFDDILDQMHAAGIRVIVDIPGQPAPIWLHKAYPGVDIVSQEGDVVNPASRYWDNISDPDYRRLVRRLAEKMMQRYAKHPAVIAVGYNNEIGNGQVSYSKADRDRFAAWLQRKYGSIEALNKAWATQRWSRRINSWDHVDLPFFHGPGPNERYLDLRRYWSWDAIEALKELEAVRKKDAPNLPVVSNLWPYSWTKGFDWPRSYDKISTYGAQGFYPGDPLNAAFEAMMNKAGHDTPVWFNEFTAGGPGYYGTPGRSRMWAYFAMMHYGQAFLAWTFNSHIGGEEQALFGLIDHDDRPSWKLKEFGQIASEFRHMQKLGFPRYQKPEIAIHYSYDTNWLTNAPQGSNNSIRDYFKGSYWDQTKAALAPLFRDNIDTSVIDVGYTPIDGYKLVVLPSAYIVDQKIADAVRDYVAKGGTVIMTGYSAKVDETAKWFDTPLPGGLTDVFGLRTNEFYRSDQPLQFTFEGQTLTGSDPYYEVLEPSSATVLATFANTPQKSPAITMNTFGKGRAIYLATAPQPEFTGPLIRSLYPTLGIKPGPVTPDGVSARTVQGRTLYVNTKNAPVTVTFEGTKTGVLSRKSYTGKIELPAFGVELLQ